VTDYQYIDRPCLPCTIGLPAECDNPEFLATDDGVEWIIPCARRFDLIDASAPTLRGSAGRPMLDPSEVQDPTSTGRKRATAIHPIIDGMRCEWAGLRHAGGGVVPIVGCRGNVLHAAKEEFNGETWPGALHHGPDKNTLNNTPGLNLHGICQSCHNRWHSVNDPYYEKPRPPAGQVWLPVETYYLHDPNTAASADEQAMSEAWWKIESKAERGDYPVVPPESMRAILPMSEELGTLPHNPFHNEKGFVL
jgi:hypothetical protein